jgi:hypothetical protein
MVDGKMFDMVTENLAGRESRFVGEGAMSPVQTTVADWLQIIRGEFAEVPGLHLTKKQFQRLWGLDGDTCDRLLDVLVDQNFLRQTPDQSYVRANVGQ